MPKPQIEDDKKHGDKLEPLIERASGRDEDEDDELEDEDEEEVDEDEEDDDK